MKLVIKLICLIMLLNLDIFAMSVDISVNTGTVKLYEKLEIDIKGNFKFKNPYDYDEATIRAEFINPQGIKKIVDAFYYKGYEIRDGEIEENLNNNFKVRFTPDKVGKWSFYIKIKIKDEIIYKSKQYIFDCLRDTEKKGFIKISDMDFLFMEFSNKDPFFAIGLNLAWSVNNIIYNYERWIKNLKENGGNFFRIWMANWFLGIEWDGKLKNYNNRQKQAFILDKILEMCEKENLYILLTLISHGEFSTQHNSNWDKNPYNVLNGGFLNKPEHFFADTKAKKIFKNRLRYIIARYGYSTSIFAWELFNEVDLTDNYDVKKILNWHNEMLSEIKKYDIYKHLKTTSFSDPYKEDVIWELKDIDFVQTHIYGIKDGAEEIYEISKYKIEKFQKPHIITEFGIDWTKDFAEKGIDKEGIQMHNALWSGIFTLSFGTPMIWWWDVYVDKYNLFSHFKTLSEFIKDINWQENSYYEIKDKNVYIDKSDRENYRDLIFYPFARWEKAKESKFIIKNNGIFINKQFFPGFIFGKTKENLKTDITIKLTNEKPGKFEIKLKKVSHDNVLTILVNDREYLKENICAKDFNDKKYFKEWNIYQADIDREYGVDLPEGDNEIIIRNDGEDWLLIDYIKITNIIKEQFANVFVSGIQSNKDVYIYIKNNEFRFDNKNVNKIKNGMLNIYDLISGRYIIQFYNTYTGEIIKESQDIVDNDILLIEIPEFESDIAVKIRRYGE